VPGEIVEAHHPIPFLLGALSEAEDRQFLEGKRSQRLDREGWHVLGDRSQAGSKPASKLAQVTQTPAVLPPAGYSRSVEITLWLTWLRLAWSKSNSLTPAFKTLPAHPGSP
jgi:hypothetical protein